MPSRRAPNSDKDRLYRHLPSTDGTRSHPSGVIVPGVRGGVMADEKDRSGGAGGFTRRGLIKGLATTAVATATAGATALAEERKKAETASAGLPVSITLNGAAKKGVFEPRTTLAEALRDAWGMTGTKVGCD